MAKFQSVLFGTVAFSLVLGAATASAELPQASAVVHQPATGPVAAAPPTSPAQKSGGRYAEPDAHHKLLKSLAGSWVLSSRTWKGAPGPEPILTTGIAEKTLILGDRFIQEDYHSIIQGQPYTGQGVTGFDTAKQKFFNTWVCTRSTGVIVSEGTVDSSGKDVVMSGIAFDHSTQQNKTHSMTIHIASSDKHTITYYESGADGKAVKIVEVDYTRKK